MLLLPRPPLLVRSKGLAAKEWLPLTARAKLMWAYDGQSPVKQFNIAGRRNTSSSHGTPVKASTALGPAIALDGTDDAITFPGFPTAAQKVTLGFFGIFNGVASGESRDFLDTVNNVNAGYRLNHYQNSGKMGFTLGGVAVYDMFTTVGGVPILLAASFDATEDQLVGVLKRFDTGQVQTYSSASITGAPNTSGDGVMAVGGTNIFTANKMPGWMAAAIITDDFVPLSMLVRWANDPWGPFRYADKLDAGVVYAKAAGGGTTYTLSASMDAAIQRALSATAGMDAAVQVPRSATASLDAAVQSARTAAAGMDAAIQVPHSATAGLDAAIRRALAATAGLDAVVVNRYTAQADLDAAIQAPRSLTVAMDAYIDDGSGAPAAAAHAGFLANVGKLMRRG